MTAAAALSCRGVVVVRGGVEILRGLDLDVEPGSLTALAGPSGIGKTTLLRAVAGLEPLVDGRVTLGGRDLAGTPPHRRRIASVFQSPRLFPNLDVAENVAFAQRVSGVRRGERLRRAAALLADVGLDGFDRRSPQALSGGEAHRVALARALSADPDLLLLDEPLSSVDPERRDELRQLIRRLQRQRDLTTLYVTHDQAEAAELGDTIALLLGGRIAQHGPPPVFFERPRDPEVAGFFGSRNLLRGSVVGNTLHLGGTPVDVPGPDGEAAFTIRPERIRVTPSGPLRATVVEAAYLGTHVRLRLQIDGCTLVALVPPEDARTPGEAVGIELPAAHLWRFPDVGSGAERPLQAPAR